MSEMKIKIISNILAVTVYIICILLLIVIIYRDIYAVGLFVLFGGFRDYWITPKIMFHKYFSGKLHEKTTMNLLTVFNEENNIFSMHNFKNLGSKGDHVFGRYIAETNERIFEYLVIIDTNYYWNEESYFPEKYNINSHNLVTLSDGKIKFIKDDMHIIIHKGHKCYFIFNENDIKYIFEGIGINNDI